MDNNFWNDVFFFLNLLLNLILFLFVNNFDLYLWIIFLIKIIKTEIDTSNWRTNTFNLTSLIFDYRLLKRLTIHCILILMFNRFQLNLPKCFEIWYSCSFLLYFFCRCTSASIWTHLIWPISQLFIVKFIRPAWRYISRSHPVIFSVLPDILYDISKQTLTFLTRQLFRIAFVHISTLIWLTIFVLNSNHRSDNSILNLDRVWHLRTGLIKIEESWKFELLRNSVNGNSSCCSHILYY